MGQTENKLRKVYSEITRLQTEPCTHTHHNQRERVKRVIPHVSSTFNGQLIMQLLTEVCVCCQSLTVLNSTAKQTHTTIYYDKLKL